jgi:hypothetical protein
LTGLARRLEHRQPEPCRSSNAGRCVSAGRDRDACAGQTQDQRVVGLAADVATSFAHSVANVADHEQIAERGSGKLGRILRFASNQSAGKARGGGSGRIGLIDSRLYALLQVNWQRYAAIVRQFDEALGEFRIVTIERRADLTDRNSAVKSARQPAVGNRHWVIGRRKHRPPLDTNRHQGRRRHCKNTGCEPRPYRM